MGGSSSKRPVEEIRVKELQPGDIVLMRERVRTDFGHIDPGVVRGVLAAQSGNYFTLQKQILPSWTHCGIVVCHNEQWLLVEATLEGVQAFPLLARLRHHIAAGSSMAARQLKGVDSSIDEGLYLLGEAALVGLQWSHATRDKDASASVAGGGGDSVAAARVGREFVDLADAGKLLDETTPWGRELVLELVPRLWSAVSQLPLQMELELCRSFATFDADDSGTIDLKEVRAVLEDLKGGSVSHATAKRWMKAMDKDSDGTISLAEFVATLAKRPLRQVPVEHDVALMLSGEFLGIVLEKIGLLPRRGHQDKASGVDAAKRAAGVGAKKRAQLLKQGNASVRLVASLREADLLDARATTSFTHFTPAHFSSLHDPPMKLLRGRLGREVLLDVRSDEEYAADTTFASKLHGCCQSRHKHKGLRRRVARSSVSGVTPVRQPSAHTLSDGAAGAAGAPVSTVVPVRS